MDAKEKHLKDTIHKRTAKYDFHVLLDEKTKDGPYKVAALFDLGAIPAQFIIDKQGIIRYKRKRFTGNTDSERQEIRLMIDNALKHEKN